MAGSVLLRAALAAAAWVPTAHGYAPDSAMRKDYVMSNWPTPGKDYHGYSHVGQWTYAAEISFPRRNLAENRTFSDLPAQDPWEPIRPPQPTQVLTTPPFRKAFVEGNCSVPRSSKFEGSGFRQVGVHVWIANLLYSEFIPWPFDLFIPLSRSMPHPDPARAADELLFPFKIPLFDHVYNKDSPLHWAQWAAGPQCAMQQAYVGQPVTPDFAWLADAGDWFQSSTPAIHSWASFGAGEWTVFCNSYVVEPTNGTMVPSLYKALDDMEQDLLAARSSPEGRYVPTLDRLDGEGRSRWGEGCAGGWLHGGNGMNLLRDATDATAASLPAPTNAITGKWGKYITFPPQYNYKQECCWRSYTGPGAVMRQLHLRINKGNVTADDCCWFGLPEHTADPYFPESNQPVPDASKMAAITNATTGETQLGYWGYRRSLNPALWVLNNVRDTRITDFWPEWWWFYGDQSGRDNFGSSPTPNLVTLKKYLEPTPLSGGILLSQKHAVGIPAQTWECLEDEVFINSTATGGCVYRDMGQQSDSTADSGAAGVFNTRNYEWFSDEWYMEYYHADGGGPILNFSQVGVTDNIGPDFSTVLIAAGGCNTGNCRKTFRIQTHGWNNFIKLAPVTTVGAFYNRQVQVTSSSYYYADQVKVVASAAPPGIRNTVMARLTPQAAEFAYKMPNPITGKVPFGNVRRKPILWDVIQRYNASAGNIGNGSTAWSHLVFTPPKVGHGTPILTGRKPFKLENAVAQVGTRGFSADLPATDGYVGAPYTFNMSELYPMRLFEDAGTRDHWSVGETPYDDLTFGFNVHAPWVNPANGWLEYGQDEGEGTGFRPWFLEVRSGHSGTEVPLATYSRTLFNAQKREGGWTTASFTLSPAVSDRLYIVNISVRDSGFTPAMVAAHRSRSGNGATFYDRSIYADPNTLTVQYYILAQPCPSCGAGTYPIKGCTGRGQPTACTACSGSCPANQYISKGCDSKLGGSGDRRCATCPTTCPSGFRLSKRCDGSDTEPAQCLPCAACPAGQYRDGGCNGTQGGTTDSICKPCPTAANTTASSGSGTIFVPAGCPISVTGAALAKAITTDPNADTTSLGGTAGAVRYRTCAQCSDGIDYAVQACSAQADTVCAACSPSCGIGTYQSIACTRDHDRTCTTCTSSCPAGKYRAAACTGTSDTRCESCTAVCPAWTYATAACTSTADTLCTACNCSTTGASACDASTGTCNCKPGFTGSRCDQCAPGVWGATCSDACTCTGAGSASTSCAARDGKCTCAAGWTGFYCDQCVAGRFGPACAGTCQCGSKGRCSDGVGGDGTCTCMTGWTGPRCTVFAGGRYQIYPGVAMEALSAREGVAVALNIPTTVFLLVSNGTQYAFSSDAANLTITGVPWLTISRNSGSPSGFVLSGTPTRADVTAVGAPLTAVLLGKSESGDATSSFSVAVTHSNAPPRFTTLPIPVSIVRVGALWRLSLTFDLNVTDPDTLPFDDVLTVAFTGLPSWATTQPVARDTAGRMVWAAQGAPPDAAAGQVRTVTVTVMDGAGATATTTTTVTVQALTVTPALTFAGLPALHAAQGSTLNFVLPASAFTIIASAPGSAVASYQAGSVSPVLTPQARQRVLTAVGTMVMGSDSAWAGPTSNVRRLAATSTAGLPSSGAGLFATYLSAVHQEMQEEAALQVEARRLERQEARSRRLSRARALAESGEAAIVRDPAGQPYATLAPEVVHRRLERQAEEEDRKEADARVWDQYDLAPRLADVQEIAAVRALAATGACAWLGLARSADTVPRPLLWGTPGPADVGSVCEVTVTATNAAGYSVTGRISVVVDDRNDPPVALTPIPPISRPATLVFSQTWAMSDLFSDADATGNGMGRDVLQFSLAELGTGGAGPAPSFLAFTCVGGGVPGAIMEVCTLRGNASVSSMGSYGLEVVARDSANASATIPLLLKITAPTTVSLRSAPWTSCSRACGGGWRYRVHTCVDYRSIPIEPANCADAFNATGVNATAEDPTEKEACNSQPCTQPYWQPHEWSPCSAACAAPDPTKAGVLPITNTSFILPVSTRPIDCMAPNGLDRLADDACAAQPKPRGSKVCNAQACPAPATPAPSPSPSPSPSAGASASPAAPSPAPVPECRGVIDPAGVCCAAAGPSGYCCLGPTGNEAIDECGVCDGLNACPMTKRLSLGSVGLAARVCPNGLPLGNTTLLAAIQGDVANAIAAAMGVSPATIDVASLACMASSTARLLTGTPAWRRLPATGPTSVSVRLSVNASAQLSAVEVDSRIKDRLAVTMQAATGVAVDVMGASTDRVTTCGNNVCELGEGIADEGASCPADCGKPAVACPIDTFTGLSCGGNGACLPDGNCRCTRAYSGSSCSSCAVGYTAKLVSGVSKCLPVAQVAGNMGVGTDLTPAFSGTPGFGALMVFVVAGMAGALFVGGKMYGARSRGAEPTGMAPMGMGASTEGGTGAVGRFAFPSLPFNMPSMPWAALASAASTGGGSNSEEATLHAKKRRQSSIAAANAGGAGLFTLASKEGKAEGQLSPSGGKGMGAGRSASFTAVGADANRDFSTVNPLATSLGIYKSGQASSFTSTAPHRRASRGSRGGADSRAEGGLSPKSPSGRSTTSGTRAAAVAAANAALAASAAAVAAANALMAAGNDGSMTGRSTGTAVTGAGGAGIGATASAAVPRMSTASRVERGAYSRADEGGALSPKQGGAHKAAFGALPAGLGVEGAGGSGGGGALSPKGGKAAGSSGSSAGALSPTGAGRRHTVAVSNPSSAANAMGMLRGLASPFTGGAAGAGARAPRPAGSKGATGAAAASAASGSGEK